jgi:hypothetical protein
VGNLLKIYGENEFEKYERKKIGRSNWGILWDRFGLGEGTVVTRVCSIGHRQ